MISDITKHFLTQTKRLSLQQEVTNERYQMFSTGSVEIEVAEFLYSLVRLIKPDKIVETGTHFVVSSAYMAAGMRENGHIGGGFVTLEVIDEYKIHAEKLWGDLDLCKYVKCKLIASQRYDTQDIDLLFLDSEPQFRFDEFVKFWPSVKPSGFILIHDLHPHLGHTGIAHHGQMDWPYGDFRLKLASYIKSHDVQVISFPSPRGFTMFQKVGVDFSANRLLKGEL
jgi:predicted O-methyltransferase YrrM